MHRVRIGLFVFFQALYAFTSSGNAFRIPDEFEVYFQTEHLIDAGDLSVPQAVAIRQGSQSMFFGKVGNDGKPYAPYGPLAAVLAVPHHLAGRAMAAMLGIQRVPREQGLAWVIFVGGVTMLATATAAALTVVGFHRAAIAMGTAPPMALLLSIVLGGGTVLWPYATSMFSEAFLAAAFMWAAVLLLESRTASSAAKNVAIAAALIVIAGLTKVTSLIVAPAFVVAILAERSIDRAHRRRAAIAVGAAIALAAALQLAWNAYRFGSPFELGYDWSETIPSLPARAFSIGEIPFGLAVLLFAPGKSLFVWAPILVVAMLNGSATWIRDRALAIGLLTAAVIGLLVYAAYLFPEGGYAHGPRHLVPIVPLLALAAAGPATRAQRRSLIYACAAAGFVVAALATRVSYLEDQVMRRDQLGRPIANYYEQITPAPGRPSNRYRLDYIPFVTAMKTPGWSQSPNIGQGPDYFYKHLEQARRQLPDGRAIPASLPGIWAGVWALIAIGAAASFVRGARRDDEPIEKVHAVDVMQSPLLQAIERRLPIIVIVLAAVLIGAELDQGWAPFDEGTLGQTAERILNGEVPHRDFDDTYTGGLAYLIAGVFTIGGIASTTMRVPVLVFGLIWVAAFHAIARRFIPPIGAALVTIVAVIWSVPNYPAPMPSWFNLFLATFGAWAMLRGLDTRRGVWMVLAGACGGLSVLFKLSGIFYLLGAGIALIGVSFERSREQPPSSKTSRSGAAVVSIMLALPLIVIAVPIAGMGEAEVFRFLLPLALMSVALLWREWRDGRATASERLGALLPTLGPFILGAAIPLALYAALMLSAGALAQTINGVFVKPFRRLDSSMMHPPPPAEAIYAIGIGILLALSARRRITTVVAIGLAVLFAAVLYWSGDSPRIYAMGVLTGWGLPLPAAAGAAWLVARDGRGSNRLTNAAFVITAIACATLLVEFPMAAPSYLFYTFPLSLLALAVVMRLLSPAAAPIHVVTVAFLLLFGLMRVNPGTYQTFGWRFIETNETTRLKLPRSGLRVSEADAVRYQALIGLVQSLAAGRRLWAGPDSPEVYFLSGVPNHTRTLFDFLDDPPDLPLIDRVHAAAATLVVLNTRPDFGPAPDQATVEALRAEFPNVQAVPGFLVFWK